MYLKLIFGILAAIVLAQLLVRCLVSWRVGKSSKHMTPKEIPALAPGQRGNWPV